MIIHTNAIIALSSAYIQYKPDKATEMWSMRQ